MYYTSYSHFALKWSDETEASSNPFIFFGHLHKGFQLLGGLIKINTFCCRPDRYSSIRFKFNIS